MVQLDALRLADTLRRRMVEFGVDDNFVRDKALSAICRRIWEGTPEDGGLVSGLWVEGAFPAKTCPYSLDDLVQSGEFNPGLCAQLDKLEAMPRGRKLYTHQFDAMSRARVRGQNGERPAIVVTAGTGAGKTESFLLPILNDLYANPTDGNEGVKCIILYPMNALVNDQVDRLYNWLKGQSRVTIFHFTSETQENKRRADDQGIPDWEPCRIRTRQEARGLETCDGQPLSHHQRGRVPDIVITNYSMLEYMLCRPQDAVFFGPALRTIVLDEAHLYTGTLAAEITLLLRRLFLRCGLTSNDVLQIATSATLGSGDTDELRDFAAQIFTKERDFIHVLTGESDRVALGPEAPPTQAPTPIGIASRTWLDSPTLVSGSDGNMALDENAELCGRLRDSLPMLVSRGVLEGEAAQERRPAVLLHRALSSSPLVHRLESTLWERRYLPLEELASILFEEASQDAIRAAVIMLQLAASARTHAGAYPLAPHRIHVMARPTDGLTVCLNSQCTCPEDLKFHPLGAVLPGIQDRCGYCGSAVLALNRCDNCGEWLLAGNRAKGLGLYYPSVHADGRILLKLADSDSDEDVESLNPLNGEINGPRSSGVRVKEVSECPHCGDEKSQIRPFASGAPLPLSILAETVLAELPEFPSRDGSNLWLPARGRRLLAFSDSRQEAARLGLRLTRQHEIQVLRMAILNALKDSPVGDEATIERVKQRLRQYQEELESPGITAGERLILEGDIAREAQRLASLTAGGSIETWAEELSKQPLLAELIDLETAHRHEASRWSRQSQQEWERNFKQVKERAKSLLGREVARVLSRGDDSLEALGLIEVTYPGLGELEAPSGFLGSLPTEEVRENLRACWTDLLAMLCDTLRAEGVITLGEEEDQEYAFGRQRIGRWCAEEETGWMLNRFIGQTQRQRRMAFAKAVLCAGRLSQIEGDANKLLSVAFRQLLEKAREEAWGWLEASHRQTSGRNAVEALRIVFSGLGLRRPPELYQCRNTGHVWCRSVLGCAPDPGCYGMLDKVSEDGLDSDPRIGRQRREYQGAPIFKIGLWAEEHSAQLNPKENRRLQDLFKAGVRNILSATTTLELGIDIGGLNGVLISNVPPGKANYLQRAGRAGRRADGSSIVVTFARPRPFDREVFRRIGDYLGQPLRKPVVFLDRDRVVRRHLHSFLLSEFFRRVYPQEHHAGAMDAFGRMGAFCGVPLPERWNTADRNKPGMAPQGQALQGGHLPWWNPSRQEAGLDGRFLDYLNWLRDWSDERIQSAVEGLLEHTPSRLTPGTWHPLIDSAIESFSQAVQDWRVEYDQLLGAWHQTSDRRQANAIRYQLSALHDLTVIEALADRQFLPHYGFPIGVHKLRVIAPDENRPSNMRVEDQYRLERGSLLALREYVPGSQLLVGGKLVTSHGLLKHWTGANIDTYLGLRGQYSTCMNGHFYYWNSEILDKCPFCGEEPKGSPPGQLLFPKHGFSGAAWDKPRWSTDVEYVGEAKTATVTFTHGSHASGDYIPPRDNFGGITGLKASYREDGELLVFNSGESEQGFAICLNCGYADSERKTGSGIMDLPSGFAQHAPITSTRPQATCWKNEAAGHLLEKRCCAAPEKPDACR